MLPQSPAGRRDPRILADRLAAGVLHAPLGLAPQVLHTLDQRALGPPVQLAAALGQIHAPDRHGRCREVVLAQPAGPPGVGEAEQRGVRGDVGPHLQHGRDHAEPLATHRDDGACGLLEHGRPHGVEPVVARGLLGPALEPAQLGAQAHVLVEVRVAPGLLQRGAHPVALVGAALDGARPRHQRAVGLELGERPSDEGRGLLHPELLDEVHGHRVVRREGAVQREPRSVDERGQRVQVQVGLVQHDRRALGVDAASAGAPRDLRVLGGREHHVRVAVELGRLLEHHGAGRHVDPQRQRLGGEDHLDQPGREQLLDDRAEQRQHPRVVGGEPVDQPGAERGEVERVEVGLRDLRDRGVDVRGDAPGFLTGRETQPGPAHLRDRAVAARAGEHEVDSGQEVLVVEPLDDVLTAGPLRARAGGHPFVVIPGPGPPALLGGGADGDEIAVRVEHVGQRHGTVLGEYDGGVAADLGDPVPQLVGVAQRRGQPDEQDGRVEGEDDLLPHHAPRAVAEVVDLVHDHAVEVVQCRRGAVDHVAQHLGGHHHDGGVRVDRVVTGEQADVLGAEALAELSELLVAQRLDRRGVEAPTAAGEGAVGRVLADEGLAGARRCGHEQVPAGVQGREGLELERIGREALAGEEPLQQVVGVGLVR